MNRRGFPPATNAAEYGMSKRHTWYAAQGCLKKLIFLNRLQESSPSIFLSSFSFHDPYLKSRHSPLFHKFPYIKNYADHSLHADRVLACKIFPIVLAFLRGILHKARPALRSDLTPISLLDGREARNGSRAAVSPSGIIDSGGGFGRALLFVKQDLIELCICFEWSLPTTMNRYGKSSSPFGFDVKWIEVEGSHYGANADKFKH